MITWTGGVPNPRLCSFCRTHRSLWSSQSGHTSQGTPPKQWSLKLQGEDVERKCVAFQMNLEGAFPEVVACVNKFLSDNARLWGLKYSQLSTLLTVCQLCVNCVSTLCQPLFNSVSTVCQQCVNHVLTEQYQTSPLKRNKKGTFWILLMSLWW